VDNVRLVHSAAGFSKNYRFNSKNQFNLGGSLNLNYNKSFVLLNATGSDLKIWNFNGFLYGRINLADKIELSQSFNLGHQSSFYSQDIYDNLLVMNRNWQTGLILRSTHKLVWDATLNHRYNSNASPGIQNQITRLNAGVTYLFLKDNRAQLKLTAFDLLNQNTNVSRIIRENMIEDVQTEVLTRYLLLTFNYNIRNLGNKGGNSSLLK
jgi:hypothetical protein